MIRKNTIEALKMNANPSVSVFTLIASLVIALFVMLFWIARLYPIKREETRELTPIQKIVPNEIAPPKPQVVQPQKLKQEADRQRTVVTPKQDKVQTKLIIITNTKAERKVNVAAARYLKKIMPKLSNLKLITLEHYTTIGQFPYALAEVGLDQNEIVDKDNIIDIHFYDKTVLLLLNPKKYGANHWVSLTTTNTLGSSIWNCYTSIYDPNNLPMGCNTHPSPPLPKHN